MLRSIPLFSFSMLAILVVSLNSGQEMGLTGIALSAPLDTQRADVQDLHRVSQDLRLEGILELEGMESIEVRALETVDEAQDEAGDEAVDADRRGQSDPQSLTSSLFNVVLSPNGRVCVSPLVAYTQVRIDGTAYDKKTGAGAGRFTVNRSSTSNGTYSEIYVSPDNSASFVGALYSSIQPQYFPGYFKPCVRNTSVNSAVVSLQLTTY